MTKRTVLIAIMALLTLSVAAIPPYYKLEVRTGTIGQMAEIVREKLASGGFRIIGESYPGDADHLYVIAFTSDELIKIGNSVADRGILASVIKVGITRFDGKVTVSVINPDYLFNAYLRDAMDKSATASAASAITAKVLATLTFEGTKPSGFGGDIDAKDLRKYKYMVGMPTFDAPVTLATYNSFEEGLAAIRNNLEAGKGKTEKVYELVNEAKKSAVFGVALNDPAKGSSHFLPIIGEDNVAAMPYEIILQGNQAIMLHGRYRFALHWPELKMSTFTKIMSSPGDVEDMLKGVAEK